MKTEELLKLLVSLVVFTSILSMFGFFRLKTDGGIFNYDEYRYITKSEKIISSEYSTENIKSNLQDPTSILLAFTGNIKLSLRMMPFLLAPLNLILIFILMKKTKLREEQKTYALVYFILSPFFIYLHTSFTIGLLCMTLMILGTLLFIENKPIAGLFFFLIILWINPWTFFIIASFLIFSLQKMRDTKKGFEIYILGLLLFIFILLKGFSLPSIFSIMSLAREYITDFGSYAGIGIFGVLTTIIGLILFFRSKENNRNIIWYMVPVFIFSLYDKFFLVFLEFFAAYFSSFGMFKIINGNWESGILKNYVTLLLFCGLVFSAGSFMNKAYKAGGDYYERISIDWLKNNADHERIVLSYYEFGHLISSSGMDAYTDKDYFLYSKERERINESNTIFMTRDLKKISAFMNNNNIGYIWINPAMKDHLVWNKEDEGILFTLKNSISFNKVYSYKGVEIWEYLKAN